MESVQGFIFKLQGMHGAGAYALLLGLLISAGVGAPVNEDLLLIGAAALTFYSVFDPVYLVPISILGVVASDLLIFHWGARYGVKLTRTRFFSKIVSEQRLLEFQNRLRGRRGSRGIFFVTRFLPGIRTPIFFASGSLRLSYKELVLFDLFAAMIQVPALIYSVRWVGGRTDIVLGYLHRFQNIILVLVAMTVAYFLVRRKKSGAGRPTSSLGS